MSEVQSKYRLNEKKSPLITCEEKISQGMHWLMFYGF